FRDKVPFGFWTLPQIKYLQNRPKADVLQYWSAVASHFDQLDWIRQSAVFLEGSTGSRANAGANSIELSDLAARILNTQSRLRVMLPLEEGQIQLAVQGDPNFVDPSAVDRLFVA